MKIFIVDDDDLLCFILKKQISKFEPLSVWDIAPNGKKALELLKKAVENDAVLPDLILLDINMPVMDGWEFLDAFSVHSEDFSKPPKICILSSSINRADREKSEKYPEVVHFFTKPMLENDIEYLSKL